LGGLLTIISSFIEKAKLKSEIQLECGVNLFSILACELTPAEVNWIKMLQDTILRAEVMCGIGTENSKIHSINTSEDMKQIFLSKSSILSNSYNHYFCNIIIYESFIL